MRGRKLDSSALVALGVEEMVSLKAGMAGRSRRDIPSIYRRIKKAREKPHRPIEERLMFVEFLTNRAFYSEAIDHFSFNGDRVITSGQPRGRSISTMQKTQREETE
jgi:hypothetical protein